MSYHYGPAAGGQNNPYGQSAQFPTQFDPGSTANLHAGGGGGTSYPPAGQGSSWSVDGDGYKDAATSGGGGGGGYVQRGADNPYAQNYKGSNGAMSKTTKWIIAGVALLVVAGIAAGIAVWQVKKNSSDSGSSSSTSSSSGAKLSYINGTAKVVKSNPNDPSDFEKDSRYVFPFFPFFLHLPPSLRDFGPYSFPSS